MIKTIFGLLLLVLGGYGIIWWHNALNGMGDPDGGRSVISYDIPYLMMSFLLLMGLFLLTQSIKKLIQRFR